MTFAVASRSVLYRRCDVVLNGFLSCNILSAIQFLLGYGDER